MHHEPTQVDFIIRWGDTVTVRSRGTIDIAATFRRIAHSNSGMGHTEAIRTTATSAAPIAATATLVRRGYDMGGTTDTSPATSTITRGSTTARLSRAQAPAINITLPREGESRCSDTYDGG